MAKFISYDDLVLSHNPIAYWSMVDTEQLPLPDQSGNGHDMDGINGATFASDVMFDYAPSSHGLDITSGGANPPHFSAVNDQDIIDAINAAEAVTLIAWIQPDPNTALFDGPAVHWSQTQYNNSDRVSLHWPDEICHSDDNGGTGASYSAPAGEANMIAIMADSTHDYIWVNGEMILNRARSSGAWPGMVNELINGRGMWDAPVGLAWAAYFDKVLTDAELDELRQRRLFQGKIAGTVTIDGDPAADALIRSHRRADGHVNGETTSDANGEYEITVLDNVEVDLAMIPPQGVAARPQMHGPILPDPYEQT